MKNRFTVGLPLNTKQIEELAELNKSVEKSSVSSFHGSLPENLEENVGLEHNVHYDLDMTYSKFFSLIEFSKNKGIDFTYLLTSIKGFQPDMLGYEKVGSKLAKLLNDLRDAGCNTLKVTNPSVIEYIRALAPDFKMILSTIAGYKDINQFRNLKKAFPEITDIVMTTDSMKNIPLINSLQKLGFNVIFMTNEGCIEGCPFRQGHYMLASGNLRECNGAEINAIEKGAFLDKCDLVRYGNFSEYVIKSNIIYPHMVESYNNVGIFDFKIAGRLPSLFRNNFQINFIKDYLMMVDNPELSMDTPALKFNRACWNAITNKVRNPHVKEYEDVTVKELKTFLPNMEHFKEFGNRCNSDCGVRCNYCNNKAKALKDWMENGRRK